MLRPRRLSVRRTGFAGGQPSRLFFLLVKGVKKNQEIRITNYRKFEVETSEKITAPVR